MPPMTTLRIREMKTRGEKITMLTAYDATMARLLDAAGIPMLLVGDSVGNNVLGYASTISVTMDDMVRHTAAVTRGVKNALVVGDMPFMSYHISLEEALRNAGRLMQEGGAHAVKLEGGAPVVETVRRIVDCGIPVMCHLGLTPQSVHQFGGFRVQGKTATRAQQLIDDALRLEEAGAFAVVLELVPSALAKLISRKLTIPTIGIGAGPDCDGQVQVITDLLGLDPTFTPKHAKKYANLATTITEAVTAYMAEVKASTFPTEANSFGMDESVIEEIEKLY